MCKTEKSIFSCIVYICCACSVSYWIHVSHNLGWTIFTHIHILDVPWECREHWIRYLPRDDSKIKKKIETRDTQINSDGDITSSSLHILWIFIVTTYLSQTFRRIFRENRPFFDSRRPPTTTNVMSSHSRIKRVQADPIPRLLPPQVEQFKQSSTLS